MSVSTDGTCIWQLSRSSSFPHHLLSFRFSNCMAVAWGTGRSNQAWTSGVWHAPVSYHIDLLTSHISSGTCLLWKCLQAIDEDLKGWQFDCVPKQPVICRIIRLFFFFFFSSSFFFLSNSLAAVWTIEWLSFFLAELGFHLQCPSQDLRWRLHCPRQLYLK